MTKKNIKVLESNLPMRLDLFLGIKLAELGISREKAKNAIKNGLVEVNNIKCTLPKKIVSPGDEINVFLEENSSSIKAEEGELNVIYSDNNFAVINKPAGLTVHPCKNQQENTLANKLLSNFVELQKTSGDRPGIIHRLDKDTTGIMLIALSEAARLKLTKEFALRNIDKTYVALVHGIPYENEGFINEPIARHSSNKTIMSVSRSGKEALSYWKCIYANKSNNFSLLAISIVTGRTHQIRVHLAHIGHPIVGDKAYGSNLALIPLFNDLNSKFKRLAKHKIGLSDEKDTEQSIIKNEQKLCLASMVKEYPSIKEEVNNILRLIKKSRSSVGIQYPSRQMLHALAIGFNKPDFISDGLNTPNGLSRAEFFCEPPQDFITLFEALTSQTINVVITGSPGCGKSSVLQILSAFGIPCISADAIVGELYKPKKAGWLAIKKRFGNEFFDEQDHIDKKILFNAMCKNDLTRVEINALIHPLVNAAIKDYFIEQSNNKEPFVVAEVPLYFESSYVDKSEQDSIVVGVACPFNIRKERLNSKRNWPDDMINLMESWQWEENKKLAFCDFIVKNDQDNEQLFEEVLRLINYLLETKSKQSSSLNNLLDKLKNKDLFLQKVKEKFKL